MIACLIVGILATGPAKSTTLADVLLRAGQYVISFQQQLSGIVAEESYTQEVRDRRLKGRPEFRRLRSDLLLVKPVGAANWIEFRDVYDVDGHPIRDRSDRLVKLFIDAPESVNEQIRDILNESARFNIGSLLRTVNTPTLPLLFLDPKNQRRFKFKRTANAKPDRATTEAPSAPGHFRLETEVWTIEFDEREPGTMIRTTAMQDLPAKGRFWIEPDTGRVLMTELILENRRVRGMIDVNYQSEPLVGLLVPIEMRERYDRNADGSVIDGFASYGHFRQFQVSVDETFAPIRK